MYVFVCMYWRQHLRLRASTCAREPICLQAAQTDAIRVETAPKFANCSECAKARLRLLRVREVRETSTNDPRERAGRTREVPVHGRNDDLDQGIAGDKEIPRNRL